MSEWISVKDRLPEIGPKIYDSVSCIVATQYNVTYAWFRRDMVRGKEVKRWHKFTALAGANEITHWMPLPQNPNELQKPLDGLG